MQFTFATTLVLTSIFTHALADTYKGKIIITNPAPTAGTCQAPVWIGIHDGSFDLYNRNEPARASIERLAEDGDNGPLTQEFGKVVGSQWQATIGRGPICPGDKVEVAFTINTDGGGPYYLSYASMVLPSNDAWLGNGNPVAYELIDAQGDFNDQDILQVGADVLDAGTEVNDEIPEHTAFFGQTLSDSGDDEAGVVTSHPGFLPAGYGGILDDPKFANADFTVEGYKMLQIQVILDTPPQTYTGKIVVVNKAPQYGTCQSPPWVGIHDSSFDLYDRNAPVRESVERLAEDGNNAPLIEDFAATVGTTWQGTIGSEPICPGESVERNFVITNLPVGQSYFVSYASMVLPSNDAWVANGNPTAHEIIDVFGKSHNAYIVEDGSSVLDAGTEVNDEIPANTAFFGQTTPNTGVVEGGVVTLHEGFLPKGWGGILDNPRFANADFTVPGYKILKIHVIFNTPSNQQTITQSNKQTTNQTKRKPNKQPIKQTTKQINSPQPPTKYLATVTIENMAPIHGTCQSPTWVGIHDGTFDLYDRGVAVRQSVERLAEDGDSWPLVEEFAAAQGGVKDEIVGGSPICPGETVSLTFDIDIIPGIPLYLSYASMVLPSNDAWIANGNPRAHLVANVDGVPADLYVTVAGEEVLDAGTEVNDEIPEHTAFLGQTVPDSGVAEYGVVELHPGFRPAGNGGILDNHQFVNADFTAIGYEMMSVKVTFTKAEPVA